MDFIAVFPCNLEDYRIIAICATSRLGLCVWKEEEPDYLKPVTNYLI